MLGISIVIPVLPALFFDPSTELFNVTTPEATRSILYGLMVAAYPFMQFFGAPLLGAWSDRYGRKPLLLTALVGTCLGYILFAYSIIIQNLELLFISRMIPGFTGGNISIVMSAIADISDTKSKVKNFGLVGAAFGIGFILGPAIGGILADNTVVSWFTHATPFWFTTILTLINILLVIFRFPETLVEKQDTKISLLTGIRNIATSFSLPNLRTIFTVVLLLSLGFTFFTQFFSVLLIQKFSFSEKAIGLLFGWVGIWLALTQGVIVRRISNFIKPQQILPFTIIGLSISIGILLLPDQSFWFYIINPLIAISYGLTSPFMTTLVSEQASAKAQGQILGINQSMQSVGNVIPPILAGYLNTLNGNFPLLAGSVLIFLSWLVYMLFVKK